MRTSVTIVVLVAAASGAASWAACGSATPAGPEHARVAVVAPAIPRAEFAVAPAELGDAGVWNRIRHRARMARSGAATYVLGGPRADDHESASSNAELPIYPVIGESGDHVRVVVDGDRARVALWIPSRDIAPTALAPVQLGDDHGRADATSGVVLGPGARLTARPPAGGLRAVELVGDYVAATGSVPAAAIGAVWIAPAGEGYDPGSVNVSEPSPLPTGAEVAAGPIRDAPRDSAAVVATAKQPLPVHIVRALGPWDEIELDAQRVHVRGFVAAPAVTEHAPRRGYGGSGRGAGYGMSDTITVAMPDGACLYDRPDGEVIGVQVGAHERFGGGQPAAGWWNVVVYNDWGMLTVVAHDVSAAADPKAASWELCKK